MNIPQKITASIMYLLIFTLLFLTLSMLDGLPSFHSLLGVLGLAAFWLVLVVMSVFMIDKVTESFRNIIELLAEWDES